MSEAPASPGPPARGLPTHQELGQRVGRLPEGRGLLHGRLAVQVVPGQSLHHAGTGPDHGHDLLLGHGQVQVLALEGGSLSSHPGFLPAGLSCAHSDPNLPVVGGLVQAPVPSPLSLDAK